MIVRFFTLLLVGVLSGRSLLAQPDSVDVFLQGEMQRSGIPGLQVAVIRHGKIVKSAAYGLANIEHQVPVTARTLFPIASATKSLAGVALMQVVEAGKLDLVAPIATYLDSLPTAWQTVSIRQLLTHTSGLPDVVNPNTGKILAEGDIAESWQQVQALPMQAMPGQQFSYNQTNYLLLGRLLNKLTNQPFTQFITEKQLVVAQMNTTGFGDFQDVVPNLVTAYRLSGSSTEGQRYAHAVLEFPAQLRAAGGLYTTADELARWVLALQTGKLLKPESLKTLFTPGLLTDGTQRGFSKQLNGYALGFPTMSRTEHPAVGGIGGSGCAFFIYPEDDLTVIILTNRVGSSPESFIDEVAGFYVPDMKAATGFGLPRPVRLLRAELLKQGFDKADAAVEALKRRDATYHLAEDDLNNWGYWLLQHDQKKEALAVFRLNTSLYPQSGNAFDSLAEACEANGNTYEAIANYQRSLTLDPGNTNAVTQLKRLRATK